MTKLRLPQLRLPTWSIPALFLTGMAIASLPALLGFLAVSWIPILCMPGFALGGILIGFSQRFALDFPRSHMTVGDLSRDVLTLNAPKRSRRSLVWSRGEVWEILCRLISHREGVPREKIRPTSHFGGGLGTRLVS